MRKSLGELVRFTAVGLAGTALYAIIAFSMNAFHFSPIAAHGVASAISLVFSYLAQKAFTFRVKGNHRRTGPRFLIATALLVFLQTMLVVLLNWAEVPERATLLASTLFYPPASYLMHTFWTFRR